MLKIYWRGFNMLEGNSMPDNRIENALPLVGQGPQAALRLSAPHVSR